MVNQHEEVKKEIHKLLGELWLDNDQRLFQWLFNYTELGKDHNSEFDKKMWVRDPFYYSDELTLCYLYAYKYNKNQKSLIFVQMVELNGCVNMVLVIQFSQQTEIILMDVMDVVRN